jgi:hypothetical protein
MSRDLKKKTAALENLLPKRLELDREIDSVWQEIRMLRIAAIRGDDDPGPLPQFLGLDEQQRTSQLKREAIERSNHEIDASPENKRALANLNSAA